MSEELLKLQNIYKNFGNVKVLKDINIKINKSIRIKLLYDQNNSLSKKIKLEQVRKETT